MMSANHEEENLQSESIQNLPAIESPIVSDVPSVNNAFPSIEDLSSKLADKQETTRAQLAISLINILRNTIIASFALIGVLILVSGWIDKDETEKFDKTSSLAKDVIVLIITAQTGLIGTALGFYFGSKNTNND
jgi:hypothetical protein